jgi:hypothetical protein
MNALNARPNRQRHIVLLALLMTLVGSIYMMTYSARIESTDTLFMFDATASLVRFGDFRLDLTHGERRFWEYEEPLPAIPLLPVNAEPLQLILAAPLYWLADVIPGIGRVHTVWLFNIVVSSASIGLFFTYAQQLGYRQSVAFVTSLLLAFGTILWPYSKTFFQEPLTLFLLLLTFYLVERWRQSKFKGWHWLVLWTASFILAIVARRAALIAFPVLAILAFPWTDRLFRPMWLRYGFLGLVVIVGGLLYYNTIPQSAQEIGMFYRSVDRIESTPWDARMLRAAMNQGVQGYLFTIGGSFWATSPVVLLAVPGMILLTPRNQMRYVIAALTMLLTYALAYAYIANFDWFGGLNWPPRFMIPTIPILMLCALPTVDYLLNHRRGMAKLLTWVSLIGVVGYSLWVQASAVSYWWGEYTTLLPPESSGFAEWAGGLNDPHYLRWVLIPQLWGVLPLDFAWIRTGSAEFLIPFVILALLSSLISISVLRSSQLTHRRTTVVALLPVFWIVSVGWGLTRIYHDDLFLDFSDGLHQSVDLIQQELADDDVLLIAELGHERFFLNYGNLSPRIISLPEHPGEQPSPDQPPQISSSVPADLVEKPTIQLIQTLTNSGQRRLWILADSSPFIPWSVRPLEHYLSTHYYPLREFDLTGADGLPVRLLEYDTSTYYHDPFTLRGPTYATDLQFGDHISLLGFNLPNGDSYNAGNTIPVSLYWMTDTPLATDYRIALHLAQDGRGVVASARDSQPVNGFVPTVAWEPGKPVWDNRSIALPPDIVAGEYNLWLSVYGEEPLSASGTQTVEANTLGVLPITITVNPRN